MKWPEWLKIRLRLILPTFSKKNKRRETIQHLEENRVQMDFKKNSTKKGGKQNG